MTDDELIARCDENYFDSMRLLCPTADTGEVRESRGLLIAATGLPVPMLNIAFVTRPLADPEAQLRETVSYFDGRGLPFLVRVREGVDPTSERAAAALELGYIDAVPGMALFPLPERFGEPPPLDIRTVAGSGELERYMETLALGFDMPGEFGRRFASPRMLDVPDSVSYAGYLDGALVATSALVISRRVAGVYNVATLPDYRGRGIGEAMTWHAVCEGAAAGCLLSSLQASEMGKPVYERMGYRVVCGYKTFARRSS